MLEGPEARLRLSTRPRKGRKDSRMKFDRQTFTMGAACAGVIRENERPPGATGIAPSLLGGLASAKDRRATKARKPTLPCTCPTSRSTDRLLREFAWVGRSQSVRIVPINNAEEHFLAQDRLRLGQLLHQADHTFLNFTLVLDEKYVRWTGK